MSLLNVSIYLDLPQSQYNNHGAILVVFMIVFLMEFDKVPNIEQCCIKLEIMF
jgi:hypothetical protein